MRPKGRHAGRHGHDQVIQNCLVTPPDVILQYGIIVVPGVAGRVMRRGRRIPFSLPHVIATKHSCDWPSHVQIVNHDWMVMSAISTECHQMRMIVRKIAVLMCNMSWIADRPQSRRQTDAGMRDQSHDCKCFTHSHRCSQLPG